MYSVSAWFSILAILLVGARQRAMSNIVHDASHGNLVRDRRSNDRLANVLAALPMGETVRNYRKTHMLHHQFLGIAGRDPDLDNHVRYGFAQIRRRTRSAGSSYVALAFNRPAWKDSFSTSIAKLNNQERFQIILWWTVAGSDTHILRLSRLCSDYNTSMARIPRHELPSHQSVCGIPRSFWT